MNFAWAPGNVIGSAAGGGLAEAGGDLVAYSVLAALCVLTLVRRARASSRAALVTGPRGDPAAETVRVLEGLRPCGRAPPSSSS